MVFIRNPRLGFTEGVGNIMPSVSVEMFLSFFAGHGSTYPVAGGNELGDEADSSGRTGGDNNVIPVLPEAGELGLFNNKFNNKLFNFS